MKSSKNILIVVATVFIISCKNEKPNSDIVIIEKEIITSEVVKVIPIKHGTLILETDTEVMYIDPTGGAEAFKGQKAPTLVLITDIHGDHLSTKTLKSLNLNKATIIAPKAVVEKLSKDLGKTIITLNNNDVYIYNNINIEALPMYNLREEALKFHTKGRGNGYLLTVKGERIYISGDTEDILEMRGLKSIDKAFVCMNLPYTMTVESAASAVLEFKPKRVFPYHYRGTEGLSDIDLFKELVNKGDKSINVVFLNWY
ncbi:MBL fold metallo-hydrolase [uncultured Winogradskyella sp.]|uniref:MBL fold metallo-hydrolase n=1 Tax=uncultured Winogradskyella sp. TaxID=395353 RepID=UPI0030DC7216|tara:strand:+ start:121 stop:891 length:771 start_codon:yes stop_codon:yes gene_type:complete